MAKGKKNKIGRIKKTHGLKVEKVARSLKLRSLWKKLQGKAKEKPISKLLLEKSNLNFDCVFIQEIKPLFDLENKFGSANESLDSFNQRVKSAFEVRTTDEKWYLEQLAKEKDRKSRPKIGKSGELLKISFDPKVGTKVFENNPEGIKGFEKLKIEIKQLMTGMSGIFMKDYEKSKKEFNVDECIAYIKKNLTWSYFKIEAFQRTKLPGVGPRSKCQNSTRNIFQSLLKDVIELTIDMKYADLNTWDQWRKKVLEPRLQKEEESRKIEEGKRKHRELIK